ncbi:hypothetical protein SKAU_G00357730 [Synaphobranchus kaupii]|uniref:Mothers against decapentaplegic homolog n=1 Tax=Synaphobranchus kaupii TaxID=118154 RepID=A0A9Q1IGK8_SYNKA|nr:hypothetical protein SKAU_G00357730 [Synaphobranchus kaupii]
MFRTKRSGLVRRLWRSRAPVEGDGETDTRTHGSGGCCMGKSTKVSKSNPGTEAELKALTHSILKKIKEKQLEALLQAVESKGGARTPCLLLPSKVDSKLGQHSYSLPLLLYKVFRFPGPSGVGGASALVRGGVLGGEDPRGDASTRSRSLPWTSSMTYLRGTASASGSSAPDNKSQLVQMVRSKIGYGIQLTRERDGGCGCTTAAATPSSSSRPHWTIPTRGSLLVHKVFPGFSIKAFDYQKGRQPAAGPNDHEFTQQPRTGFTVQISFVKGWGSVLHQTVY